MNDFVMEKAAHTPSDSGVYLMKDADGRVIYVGKALNLKKRLASYFIRNGRKDAKTSVLLKHVVDLETIITGTEKEALILESNLIKKYRPRYNVVLKDDKRYPSLMIDYREDFPNIRVVRKVKNDGCIYFGPFSSAQAVRDTLKFIHKTFKIRKCKSELIEHRDRPCLNYQMNTCLAPCCMKVSKDVYRQMIDDVVLFLRGKAPDLIRKIKSEMTSAAENNNFEKAAELRDRMFALEKTLEKQVAATSDFKDRDVIGLASDGLLSTITLLTVRNGFLKGAGNFHFNESAETPAERVASFIKQYYEKFHFSPEEILLSIPLPSSGILEDVLAAILHKKIRIRHPYRGEKKRLVEMAVQNAQTALRDAKSSGAAAEEILKRLQWRLDLQRLPNRIECIDNSNISGDSAAAAMVVFEKGIPKKSDYRKYHIKTVQKPDDYATMWEILHRRFVKHGWKTSEDPLPDLLIVDGGKGQLNIAVDVVTALGLYNRFDIISIAKKDETKGEGEDKVYKPKRANAVAFGKEHDLLLFIQRIRDESHRFAITFHRRKSRNRVLQSELDGIPGVGMKRKKNLLRHFKGIRRIGAASIDELCRVPGMNRKAAESVYSAFHKG
ncbi:MAG: excinuclease ABC subunit UvrC [Desulfobacterales bacterium]